VRQAYGPQGAKRASGGPPLPCAVAGRTFTCQVPARLPIDVEVSAPGFVPHYLWDVLLKPGPAPQDRILTLLPGASLAGWVTTEGGRPAGQATVSLRGGPAVKSNARGFFQFTALAPGLYHVRASSRELASGLVPAPVVRGEERRLAPLRLDAPASLEVTVDPAVDEHGDPWLVRLTTADGSHGDEIVSRAPIASDGFWRKASLSPGRYRLSLLDARGDTVHGADLELVPGPNSERVVLRGVRASGTVTVGGRPLAGTLKLAEVKSGVRASYEVRDGAFAGTFPHFVPAATRWIASLRSADPPLKRTIEDVVPVQVTATDVRFTIALPDGRIEGVVRDAAGRPAAADVITTQAFPSPEDKGEQSFIEAQTDPATGRFTLEGLEEGDYRVYATAPGRRAEESQSEVAAVRADEEPGQVELVLKESIVVSGRVMGPGATPVAGASVIVFARDAPDVLARRRATDETGRYTARLPAGTRDAVLIVSAAGVGHSILGRGVPANRTIDVALYGTGTVDLEPGATDADPGGLVLLHDGGYETWLTLGMWNRMSGGFEHSPWRLPLMAPGFYRLCRSLTLADPAAFLAGRVSGERCDEGTLEPGRTLTLRIPASPLP
jgi:hypothetical protein